MKKSLLSLLTLVAALALPACKTSDITPDNVQLGATTITTNALAFLKPTEQAKVAGETEAAAHAVRTLSTGSAPTVDQFKATLKQFGGPDISQGYLLLAANLSALYQAIYPKLAQSDNAKEVVSYLEALALGVEAGAAPYLPVSP